ncbi:hypothetical protein AMTR_s00161p00078000 [Amborella trichopoda]|uniref:Uncharacterized protein n=1 Tax=Amborella trichopoda TaxID=13333 RepID=W1PT85_AMBTC|nr:hypothetical protein AMTR_s00161p00078000 [Amborella trichopoda]
MTLVLSSPRRTSSELAPCHDENAPSGLAEASGATNGAADEGPITVQGDEVEIGVGSEQHEAAAPGNVGDEGPSPVGEEEPIFSKQPEMAALDEMAECDEGLNIPQGEKPSADETLEEHEVVVLEVAVGMGDGGLDTTWGEAPEESGGMGFEVALPEEAIDMTVVSLEVNPHIEVTAVAATSAVIPSTAVISIPDLALTVTRGSGDPGMAEDALCACIRQLRGRSLIEGVGQGIKCFFKWPNHIF